MMSYAAAGPRTWICAIAFLAIATLVAGCNSSRPTPSAPGPGLPAVGEAPAVAAQPSSTPTPLPTRTPLPTPTPTPLPAASQSGDVSAGQLIFGTLRQQERPKRVWALPRGGLLTAVRKAEELEDLWWLPAGGALTLLRNDVIAHRWECAATTPARCVIANPLGDVLVLLPGQTPTIYLDRVPAVTGVSISPDGGLVEINTPNQLSILRIDDSQLEFSALVTNTAALTWAPNSTALAWLGDIGEQQALMVWQQGAAEPSVLAYMDEIRDLAWSHDSQRLAFAARQAAETPERQASELDVFLADLESTEIRNLTEIYLLNRGRSPSTALAAWAPAWTADDSAVRYVRGLPADPAQQTVVNHPLASRVATPLWPAAEEGLLGLLDSPDGARQARLVERDGQQVVQTRLLPEGEWQDASQVAYSDVQALVWAPVTPLSGDDAGVLVVQPQALYTADLASGQADRWVAACAACQITRIHWLP